MNKQSVLLSIVFAIAWISGIAIICDTKVRLEELRIEESQLCDDIVQYEDGTRVCQIVMPRGEEA